MSPKRVHTESTAVEMRIWRVENPERLLCSGALTSGNSRLPAKIPFTMLFDIRFAK